MEIEVNKLRLAHEAPMREGGPVVLAYAAVLIDGAIVIDDLRVVRLADGRNIVAFPDRHRRVSCVACPRRVARLWRFCPGCGVSLPDPGPYVEDDGRESYYRDLIHPVSDDARRAIERPVLVAHADAVRAEYEAEMAARAERARLREAAPDAVVA